MHLLVAAPSSCVDDPPSTPETIMLSGTAVLPSSWCKHSSKVRHNLPSSSCCSYAGKTAYTVCHQSAEVCKAFYVCKPDCSDTHLDRYLLRGNGIQGINPVLRNGFQASRQLLKATDSLIRCCRGSRHGARVQKILERCLKARWCGCWAGPHVM